MTLPMVVVVKLVYIIDSTIVGGIEEDMRIPLSLLHGIAVFAGGAITHCSIECISGLVIVCSGTGDKDK